MRTLAVVLFGGVLVIVSAAGPGAAAPVPRHLMKAPGGDRGKLPGKWKVDAIKLGGTDLLAAENMHVTIEFRGDTLTTTSNIRGKCQTTTATVKHDAGAGAGRFTLTATRTVDQAGQPVPGADEKDQSLGYAFDGDKLVLVSSTEGAEKRPVDPLKPGPSDVVLVLTRVKEK